MIEWSRLSGETIEELVAVLLCRRFPAAMLIRPSKGDGGVDVLVPLDIGDVEVYQIKKFALNLTSSQKCQIAESFNRFSKYSAQARLDVRAWHLTLPLNPTKENLTWLKGLTEIAAYPCCWQGLNFVDGLASEFPDVIDYYLHDGADRLATAVGQMTNAMGLKPKEDGSGQITPVQLSEYLRSMQPLLDTDPHFRYGISLDPAMPQLPADPGLLLAVSSSTTDPTGPVVTVKVFPRFAAALEFRPIPINVTFHPEPDTQFADDLAAFLKYGTPLQTPTGSVKLTADLPGGLGGSWEGGSAQIGPPLHGGPGHQIRLAAVAPDRTVQAEVLMDMAPVTVGLKKTGVRARGTDRDGVFDVEILADLDDQQMTFSLALRDMTGRRPAELLPAVRFLLALRPPNELAIAAPYGPIAAPTVPLATAPDWLDVDHTERLLLLLETLIAIQAHTTVQLVIPKQESLDADSTKAWITARRLLEGESVEIGSAKANAHLHPNAEHPEGQFPFCVTSEFSIRIGDQVVDLGQQIIHCALGEIEPGSIQKHGDHVDVTVRAVEGTAMTIRLARTN